MGLFDGLVPMTREQAVQAADALHAGDTAVAVRVGRQAYVVFISSAARGLPYELDFICTGDDMTREDALARPPTPLGMTREDGAKLLAWASPAVQLICTLWKQRHPPRET